MTFTPNLTSLLEQRGQVTNSTRRISIRICSGRAILVDRDARKPQLLKAIFRSDRPSRSLSPVPSLAFRSLIFARHSSPRVSRYPNQWKTGRRQPSVRDRFTEQRKIAAERSRSDSVPVSTMGNLEFSRAETTAASRPAISLFLSNYFLRAGLSAGSGLI